jgi:hypothetical protein
MDAGPSVPSFDAGVADAGRPADGGNSDAGSADAGSADAGSADAGSADAGSSDAGSSDAGSSDAGSSDAGDTDAGRGDAGGVDAGSEDAATRDSGVEDAGPPTPESCNGQDDDRDGRIDEAPDGGLLTRDCPLTLGVCRGSQSTCLSGQFQPCAYPPSYQRVETACDGVDNDCDGQVDRSVTKTLFSWDAGRPLSFCDFRAPSPLCFEDVAGLQLLSSQNGYVFNSGSRLAFLDQELNVISSARPPVLRPLSFAHSFPAAHLVTNGAEWFRVVYECADCIHGGILSAYPLQQDGGSPTDALGDLAPLATYFRPLSSFEYGGVAAVAGGVQVVGFDRRAGEPVTHVSVSFRFDGGVEVISRDAGFQVPRSSFGHFTLAWDGGFGLWSGSEGLIRRFDGSLNPLAATPLPQGARLVRAAPPLLAVPSQSGWAIVDTEGVTLFSLDAGAHPYWSGATWGTSPTDAVFMALEGADGGWDLASLRNGMVHRLGPSPASPSSLTTSQPILMQLDGGLYGMVWYDADLTSCLNCEVNDVRASFICVP